MTGADSAQTLRPGAEPARRLRAQRTCSVTRVGITAVVGVLLGRGKSIGAAQRVPDPAEPVGDGRGAGRCRFHAAGQWLVPVDDSRVSPPGTEAVGLGRVRL